MAHPQVMQGEWSKGRASRQMQGCNQDPINCSTCELKNF
ncbi:hypothetical protein L579_3127 [Pantoea sp. AS-PWVM4]|nr:hypothetical protein L579_3127 [Pantoea sp. AS-PWVM4]